jgi:hypothetical protein
MSGWTSNKANEHRFDLGNGAEILVVHGGPVSRSHACIVPTFWRTDGRDFDPDARATILAAPLDIVKRAALTKTRSVLLEALARIDAALASSVEPDAQETPAPSSPTVAGCT